ncbi:phage virion morphogenesis protein [Vibrio parahaemolyticus]|uniref:phage virion morphogenesis protein n=1 Tax=Vibrio parahaemolyticus TaxID=670 RepID=UPI0012998E46|nr:phage virion morphogenesis protein [Vibrio parahaemolyticus]MRE02422.1 phage virion morphogenesis protein [Vibrio parahaemolyticus]
MAGVNYTLKFEESQKLQRRLNQLLKQGSSLLPAFQDIGEMLLISHDKRFRDQVSPDGEPWAPLSPAYQARKPKRQNDILTLNSILSGNLSYIATGSNLFFGTPQEYGAIHHFGGSEGMRPSNAAILARPWLGVDDDDKAEIYDILSDFLLQE